MVFTVDKILRLSRVISYHLHSLRVLDIYRAKPTHFIRDMILVQGKK